MGRVASLRSAWRGWRINANVACPGTLLDFVTNFAVETFAGLIGVFAGMILALWTERRREARRSEEERAGLDGVLAQARSLLLSSVVKNTSEAKRLRNLLGGTEDPYLFQVSFELSDWEATQDQFVRIARLDERVLLTRFFGQVSRLVRLIDFHRQIRAQLELREAHPDPGDQVLLQDTVSRLRVVADDVRIDGLVVVTDLGDPIHKRLLGMKDTDAQAPA